MQGHTMNLPRSLLSPLNLSVWSSQYHNDTVDGHRILSAGFYRASSTPSGVKWVLSIHCIAGVHLAVFVLVLGGWKATNLEGPPQKKTDILEVPSKV